MKHKGDYEYPHYKKGIVRKTSFEDSMSVKNGGRGGHRDE